MCGYCACYSETTVNGISESYGDDRRRIKLTLVKRKSSNDGIVMMMKIKRKGKRGGEEETK